MLSRNPKHQTKRSYQTLGLLKFRSEISKISSQNLYHEIKKSHPEFPKIPTEIYQFSDLIISKQLSVFLSRQFNILRKKM